MPAKSVSSEQPYPLNLFSFVGKGTFKTVVFAVSAVALTVLGVFGMTFSAWLWNSSAFLGLGTSVIVLAILVGTTRHRVYPNILRIYRLFQQAYLAYSTKKALSSDETESSISPPSYIDFISSLERETGITEESLLKEAPSHLKGLEGKNSEHPLEGLRPLLADYQKKCAAYEKALAEYEEKEGNILGSDLSELNSDESNKDLKPYNSYDLSFDDDAALFKLYDDYFEKDVLQKKLQAAFSLYLMTHPSENHSLEDFGTFHFIDLNDRQKEGTTDFFRTIQGKKIDIGPAQKLTIQQLSASFK